MTTKVLRKIAVLALLSSITFIFASTFSPVVLAAAPPTPSGLVGACNMAHAWDVGALGGMAQAMSVNNLNGDNGMGTAVTNSGAPPGNC